MFINNTYNNMQKGPVLSFAYGFGVIMIFTHFKKPSL